MLQVKAMLHCPFFQQQRIASQVAAKMHSVTGGCRAIFLECIDLKNENSLNLYSMDTPYIKEHSNACTF